MILECPSCHARFKVADSAIPDAGRVVRCSQCTTQWRVDKQSAAVATLPVPPAEPNFDAEAALAEVRAAMQQESTVVETEPSAEARVQDEDFLSKLEAVISASEAEMYPRDTLRVTPSKTKRSFITTKFLKRAVPVLAVAWIVLAFIAYFPKGMKLPVIGSMYHVLGVRPTDGLVFTDVTMERERLEGGKTQFILAGSISNHSNETRAVPTVRVRLNDAKGAVVWGRSYPVNTVLKAGEIYPFRIGNVETMFASSVTTVKVDMGNNFQLMVR